MKLEEFNSQLSRKGFLMLDDNALGLIEGFPCLLSHSKASIALTINVAYDDNDKKLRQSIENSLKDTCVKGSSISYGAELLRMTFRAKDINGEDLDVIATLSDITRAISLLGLRAPETCHICGGERPDVTAWYSGAYRVLHRNCVEELSVDAAEKIETNERLSNPVLGLLGAFLGMLVGIIPSILTIIYADGIFSYLFALIPICVCFGYKKLGGKTDITMPIVCTLLSIVSVFFIQLANISIVFAQIYGFEIASSIRMAAEMFLSLGDLWAIIADSGSLFLFAALGIWISWKTISRTGRATLRSTEAIKSTIRDYTK